MYTNKEIWRVTYPIFLGLLAQNVINVTEFIETNHPSGNARWARNVYQAMLQAQARRVAFMEKPSNDDLTYINNEDVDAAIANTPAN